MPLWAKQMEIFILEDMNELEAAKIRKEISIRSLEIHQQGLE